MAGEREREGRGERVRERVVRESARASALGMSRGSKEHKSSTLALTGEHAPLSCPEPVPRCHAPLEAQGSSSLHRVQPEAASCYASNGLAAAAAGGESAGCDRECATCSRQAADAQVYSTGVVHRCDR